MTSIKMDILGKTKEFEISGGLCMTLDFTTIALTFLLLYDIV